MNYQPIYGKTYSLFGQKESTDFYYHKLDKIVDTLLLEYPNHKELLNIILRKIRRTGFLNNITLKTSQNPVTFEAKINNKINTTFSEYTFNVKEHLKHLSLFKRFTEKSLSTTEEQYHLKMILIELINRLNKNNFKEANYRIALLPHCLSDLTKSCKSKIEGFDYVCKSCSKECYTNAVTKLLKINNIEPYIWKTINIKSLFKKLKIEYGSFGVLGIACIPELYSGMVRCMRYNIPVIGLPLDANRCVRWMGEFYNNSINLSRLENLVK